MNKASEIKELAMSLGADACGLAPVSRFDEAPAGFHPTDLFPACRSVLVFLVKLPESVLTVDSPIPYSVVDETALHEVMRISLTLSVHLEWLGMAALPVPSEPYEYWEAESMTGKGLLSLKHAAVKAGLGVMGRNQLLCHPTMGNMVKIGALLLGAELEADAEWHHDFCSDYCNLCFRQCPSGALGTDGVLQRNCRTFSEGSTRKGAPITVCFQCRKSCPHRGGWHA